MRKVYFSTFIAGTGDIIERALKKRQQERFKILSLLDGLVVYESGYELRDIRALRFFNNTFLLLSQFYNLGVKPIEVMMGGVIEATDWSGIKPFLTKGKRTFKIVASEENQMAPVDRTKLRKLEAMITRELDLKLDIHHPDIEFWFLARREGVGFFGMRLTYPLTEERPEKGELRHELAHILCLASNPKPNDVFLDPFAGSGAIPLERAHYFPFKKVIAVDKDQKLVDGLKKKIADFKKNIVVEAGDALNLKNIEDSSIDKIVTDPPWGIYEEIEVPLSDFYSQMLAEFDRILKPGGVLVLLISNKEIFDLLLSKLSSKLELIEKHDILVSGKKAAIYKLRKAVI